jgi:hypothetical protein
MPGPTVLLKKSLLFVHRWLGVALCILFVMWFASGTVMMYWDFPSVTDQDRLERSPALDVSAIKISPVEALSILGMDEPPEQVRIGMFDGRPVYRFRWERSRKLIYADTGEEQRDARPEMLARTAAQWTGQPARAARVEKLEEPDQWTVQGEFRALRPLWKYAWPNGEQVYVSEVSGEVLQYTSTSSRVWAWLGPIPHWMYFLPLRKHGQEWTRFVIWTSGIGTVAALLGMILGLWMYTPRRRVPYRGQKRWHTIFGLIFGLSAVTWVFSGLLSMEPFPSLSGGDEPESAIAIEHALRGDLDLKAFPASPPASVAVKELEFLNFNSIPVYLAHLNHGETQVIPVNGQPAQTFDTERVSEIVRRAAGGALEELRVLDDYDRYYLDRRNTRPLPVILARTKDARIYIDPRTARIVGGYTAGDWTNRWLYHGLHSLNFPWLYKYRPLWDIVVISLLAGGCGLSITSLILAWRVVRRLVTS